MLARPTHVRFIIGLDADSHGASQELEGLSRALKRALFVCPNHKGLHATRGEVHRRLQVGAQAVSTAVEGVGGNEHEVLHWVEG